MGIFNTISEISKNKSNFKRWEEAQRLEEAKREELYQNKQHSEEEIAEAQSTGKTIINAIDVMDNHSESVAENIETATEPIVFLAPFLGTTVGGWAAFKYFINPASKKMNANIRKFLDTNEVHSLYKKIQKEDPKFRYLDLTKKKKIKKIKNLELRKEAQKLFDNNLLKKNSLVKSSYITGGAVVLSSLLLSFIGSIIASTNLQVRGSRVARFQARQELVDPKNFVNYTPEQIEQAKAEMLADKEAEKSKGISKRRKKNKEEKSKLKQGFWGSLINVVKDSKKYKNYKKNESEVTKIVTRELTDGEKARAEKDQEVIQRIVRKVNNEAEKYSENMEVASDVLILGTPALGAVVGGATSWILNKTKLVDKAIHKSINKNSSEETKKLLHEYEACAKNKKLKGITGLIKKLGSFSKYAESSISDLKAGAREVNPSSYFKRGVRIALTSAKGRNWLFGILGSITTGFAGLIIGLKLQKSAARAGRYTAKREIEKDPRNFIGYTKEEYDEIDDNIPVKKESKFKEVVLFIPRVLKQYFEYSKYKKTEFKDAKELKKYLHNQEVSDEQLKDAKNLQRKVFNTFEKVDDNSQIYSESMEAAIEIVKPFVAFGGYLAAITPFILAGVGIYKVRENPAKIIEKFSRMAKNNSILMNNKLTKGYLNSIAKNVPNKIAEVDVQQKPLAFLLKDVNLKDQAVLNNVRKIFKNLKLSPDELRNQPPQVIEDAFNQAYYKISSFKIGDKKIVENLQLENFFSSIRSLDASDKINALDLLLNPTKIKNISDESFNRIVLALTNNKEIPMAFFSELVKKLPLEQIRNSIMAIKQDPKIKDAIGEETIDDLIKILSDENLAKSITNGTLDKKNITIVVEIFNKFGNKINKLSEELKNSSKVKDLLDTNISLPEEIVLKLEECRNNPMEFKKLFTDVNLKDLFMNINSNSGGKMTQIKINDIINTPKVSLQNLKNKYITNPSSAISELKNKVINASPEELQKIIEKTPLKNIKDLDKETLIKILNNLEVVINKVPKKELKNIMDTVITEFNKNPDEFVKLVKQRRIKELFMTPELQKALLIAGISIPTFSLVITYIIESWLADMQIKAGRLGVMKSLDDLSDIRYYANVEI